MKPNFASKLFTVLLILVFAATAFAQEPYKTKPYTEKLLNSTLHALNNELPAIVESSLFITLELKDRYPEQNYKKIVDRLEDLSKEGPTLAIRYKAGLAAIYYNYYDQFKDIKILDNENPDQYFSLIASRIQSNYFALK